jgi:hypothetical protein
MPETDNRENLFRKYLYNEITAVVALIGITFGVINWVNNPTIEIEKNVALIQRDIENINANHLMHIQDIVSDMKDLQIENNMQNEERRRIELEIRETLTLLKQLAN